MTTANPGAACSAEIFLVGLVFTFFLVRLRIQRLKKMRGTQMLIANKAQIKKITRAVDVDMELYGG